MNKGKQFALYLAPVVISLAFCVYFDADPNSYFTAFVMLFIGWVTFLTVEVCYD